MLYFIRSICIRLPFCIEHFISYRAFFNFPDHISFTCFILIPSLECISFSYRVHQCNGFRLYIVIRRIGIYQSFCSIVNDVVILHIPYCIQCNGCFIIGRQIHDICSIFVFHACSFSCGPSKEIISIQYKCIFM